MLIDINLLPEKEERNKSLLFIVMILAVLFFVGGIAMYWLNRSYEMKISLLDQQIEMTNQLIAIHEEKINNVNNQSIKQLEETVKWAENYPMKSVPVIQKLVALLPERGFIESYSYEELGTVQLTVQFEMSREAAYYLNSLLESDWITDAKLLNVSAKTYFFDQLKVEEETSGNQLLNEKYIPRYLAEYEITLDREILKGQSSDEEGGTSP